MPMALSETGAGRGWQGTGIWWVRTAKRHWESVHSLLSQPQEGGLPHGCRLTARRD